METLNNVVGDRPGKGEPPEHDGQQHGGRAAAEPHLGPCARRLLAQTGSSTQQH